MQRSRRSLITGQPQTPAAAAAYAAQAMAPHPKTRLIFDMHSHIEMAPPRRPDGSYDIAVDVAIRDAYLDRLGFTATVLMTRQFSDRPNGAADTSKQNDFVAWYRDNNRRRYPAGLGNIDPVNGVAAGMAELRRMHEELKLDGVIFHNGPQTTYMDDIHGMHLVGKLCPNVMFDTTACWQKGRWFTRFVKDFGSRRIVFGTDMNALPNVVYHFPPQACSTSSNYPD
jgi:predicted TIM-barrel fold metal-dependent hydrolase